MDTPSPPAWTPAPPRRGWADLLALGVWTAAVVLIFRDVVTFRGALYYFDITEINYPYRDFFARELRAGRFSRWMPGLYCGFPLYAESQAGYLHPFKYVFYPFMETWKALNLDTVLSVWLAGAGTYGWLRRHVGPSGALTGAAIFGLSGYVSAHLIHTSMINALASVPLAVWALESAWDGGRLRPVALGGLAMACQVFAGHLQDTILTAGILGLYALYRAATVRDRADRLKALAVVAGIFLVGASVSAIQWNPSREYLNRSPRAGGLDWEEITFGSWHPELLPTLLVREAYGTRARDTDWLDGYYPYHEMNVYMGLVGLALSLVGVGAYRDRWVGFWVLLAMVGAVMMLGRFTVVFDVMPHVPIIGSGRIPVRYHLWVVLAVSALAAVGVDRLSRPGPVRLRGPMAALGLLVLACVPILYYVYEPAWSEAALWVTRYHKDRSRWLTEELIVSACRTFLLLIGAGVVARLAIRAARPEIRRRWAAVLPLLALADLLGAHWNDCPTIDPTYWTVPPPTVPKLQADPGLRRVFGLGPCPPASPAT